jgi:rod shape determining protein RodA
MSQRGFVPAFIADALPWRLILVLCMLVGFGSLVLYSAAGGNWSPWAGMHLVRFTLFLVVAIVLSYLPEEWFKRAALPTFALFLFLLLGVELLGAVKGGAQRWLELGVIRLQPSEFMKPAIVMALAFFYSNLPPGHIRTWQALWPAAVLMGLPVGLVMLQPDLGTGIAIAVGGVSVIFLAGISARLFVTAAIGGLLAIPVAFFTLLHDYQRNRILIFLNPESDPLGTGYHISQSKIAIGSGGFFGKGFLNGTQSHLDYLPEGHTDFVFATMAEEWGMLGGLFLLGCFGYILWWGWNVAQTSTTRYGRLAAGGLTTTIFFYMAINLLMVVGLAPVVGIPLPFMSYGGSSMLTVMLCIGMIMAIERRAKLGDGRLR